MDLVLACPFCGQKNRCPRVDVKIRCGKCKSVLDVLTIVARYAAELAGIAKLFRTEHCDVEDEIVRRLAGLGFQCEPDDDGDDGDDDD